MSRHVVFNENHFPFFSPSTGSQPSISSSNSSSWLSSFLYFHHCQSSSVLGPIPITTPPITPTTNTTPPINPTPNLVHLPSILSPHPFTNTNPASISNPTPQAHLPEPSILNNSPSSQMPTDAVPIISPIPNPKTNIPNPFPPILPLSSHPMTT